MTTLCLAITTAALALGLWARTFSLVPELFRLNKKCQQEGYYTAEFEFRMLGFAYMLDKGEYEKAASGIARLHRQMRNREGMPKVPKFADKTEEMEFYLSLQNQRTGAFMSDSFPYCTWEGPTENVIIHLDALAKETGRPLKLRYPLRFLDRIDDTVELKRYMDELGNIGWLASKQPESSFHLNRDLLQYGQGQSAIERNGLHAFSPAWRRTVLRWFHENQDPETGYWGPRRRGSGKLVKFDLHNTGSIARSFIDTAGNDIHPEFPLKRRDRMFATTLMVMSEPRPDAADDHEWHGWMLRQGKGAMVLTRYLWKNASDSEKALAKTAFARHIEFIFRTNWSKEDGAFRMYAPPGGATLDGTGTVLGFLDDAGAFSPAKQHRVWGFPGRTCASLGTATTDSIRDADLDRFRQVAPLNSVRIYRTEPDTNDFTRGVDGLAYLSPALVPDLVEIAPRLKAWIDTTTQSVGNWTSREDVAADIAEVGSAAVPVWRDSIPTAHLNGILHESGNVTVVGFDEFQVPIARLDFRLEQAATDTVSIR